MQEDQYLKLVDQTFRRILDAFDDVDAELADVESGGDVITISFANGKRCVINTQRPVQQIWLAGGQQAWHFNYDAKEQRWLDDKGSGAELLATLSHVAQEVGQMRLSFKAS